MIAKAILKIVYKVLIFICLVIVLINMYIRNCWYIQDIVSVY